MYTCELQLLFGGRTARDYTLAHCDATSALRPHMSEHTVNSTRAVYTVPDADKHAAATQAA